MSYGQANYDAVLASLRRQTPDQMFADVLADFQRAIAAQKETIKMQHQMMNLYRQALGLPVESDAV
jgi:muconolactone delta-isomerase